MEATAKEIIKIDGCTFEILEKKCVDIRDGYYITLVLFNNKEYVTYGYYPSKKYFFWGHYFGTDFEEAKKDYRQRW